MNPQTRGNVIPIRWLYNLRLGNNDFDFSEIMIFNISVYEKGMQ